MSNVFISHSSHDKHFVTRLASALLTQGFPVWLDSWSIEIGDSLIDGIYDGIDRSGFMILVLSKDAVNSGWVNKEINAALSKEQQLERKFVIPIRIDDCKVPLKIADRLYADFASSFSEPFAALTQVLERYHARELVVSSDRELLAVSFTREVNLDQVSFAMNLKHIRKRQASAQLTADQIVVVNDPEFDALQKRLHSRLDNFASDPFYSHELETSLRSMSQLLSANRKHLSVGLSLMSNQGCLDLAIYWFARIVRARMVYTLWSAQRPDLPDILEYGQSWGCASLVFDTEARQFFETEDAASVDIWRDENRRKEYFHLWVGKEVRERLLNEDGAYEGSVWVADAFTSTDLNKYLFPQMVLSHLRKGIPMIWDVKGAIVGLA